MSSKIEILERLRRGETVYLLNEREGIVVRSVLMDDIVHNFSKFRKGKEYRIKSSTNVVQWKGLVLNEISKEEYENY